MKTLHKVLIICILPLMQHAKPIDVEIYAKVPEAVGNIAYTYKGELVYSNHPFYAPKIRVMHYDWENKKATPYPNKAWNTPRNTDDMWFDSVLGIRSDSKGNVWILDMGQREGLIPKLVGWNTQTNTLKKIYYISKPASLKTSQLNDFIVDETHGVFIIADEDIGHGGDGSKAALVVVDMKTGVCRRLLESDKSTVPENIPIIVDKKTLYAPESKNPILVGVDGITADKKNKWLYYAPLSGSKIFKVKISDLINTDLSKEALSQKVKYYAAKSNAGGLSIDKENNLYMTYIESKSIGVVDAKERKTHIYASHEMMAWPDGVSYNKDGYMYVSAAQLPKASVFNTGIDKTTKPFYIFRFKPMVEGIFGR